MNNQEKARVLSLVLGGEQSKINAMLELNAAEIVSVHAQTTPYQLNNTKVKVKTLNQGVREFNYNRQPLSEAVNTVLNSNALNAFANSASVASELTNIGLTLTETDVVVTPLGDTAIKIESSDTNVRYYGSINVPVIKDGDSGVIYPPEETVVMSLYNLLFTRTERHSDYRLALPYFTPGNGYRVVLQHEQVASVSPYNEVEGAINYPTTLTELILRAKGSLIEITPTTPRIATTFFLNKELLQPILQPIYDTLLELITHYLVIYLVDPKGAVVEHRQFDMAEFYNINSPKLERQLMLDGTYQYRISVDQLPEGFADNLMIVTRDASWSTQNAFMTKEDGYYVSPKMSLEQTVWLGSQGTTAHNFFAWYKDDHAITVLPPEAPEVPPGSLTGISWQYSTRYNSMSVMLPDFEPDNRVSRVILQLHQVNAAGIDNPIEEEISYHRTLADLKNAAKGKMVEISIETRRYDAKFTLGADEIAPILNEIATTTMEDYKRYLVVYLVNSKGVVIEHQQIDMEDLVNIDKVMFAPTIKRQALLDGTYKFSFDKTNLPPNIANIQIGVRNVNLGSGYGSYLDVTEEEFSFIHGAASFDGYRVWLTSQNPNWMLYVTDSSSIVDVPAETAVEVENTNTVVHVKPELELYDMETSQLVSAESLYTNFTYDYQVNVETKTVTITLGGNAIEPIKQTVILRAFLGTTAYHDYVMAQSVASPEVIVARFGVNDAYHDVSAADQATQLVHEGVFISPIALHVPSITFKYQLSMDAFATPAVEYNVKIDNNIVYPT